MVGGRLRNTPLILWKYERFFFFFFLYLHLFILFGPHSLPFQWKQIILLMAQPWATMHVYYTPVMTPTSDDPRFP
jgi:hypothetical protein